MVEVNVFTGVCLFMAGEGGSAFGGREGVCLWREGLCMRGLHGWRVVCLWSGVCMKGSLNGARVCMEGVACRGETPDY